MATFWNASSTVYHIEVDLENSTRLVFSTHALQHTDGKATNTIAGKTAQLGYAEGKGTDAEFNFVTGFFQVNASHIIAVDNWNHCLRSIDRAERSTSPFAGECTNPGYEDGVGQNALFYYPRVIIRSIDKDRTLVADRQNHAIREVNLMTAEVKTFQISLQESEGIRHPLSLTFDPEKEVLFVGAFYYFGRLSMASEEFQIITGSYDDGGDIEGSFEFARIFEPLSLVALSSSLVLASDARYDKIRLFDLVNKEVSVFCPGNASGNCELMQPRSLLLTRNHFFVADYKKIKVASGKHDKIKFILLKIHVTISVKNRQDYYNSGVGILSIETPLLLREEKDRGTRSCVAKQG